MLLWIDSLDGKGGNLLPGYMKAALINKFTTTEMEILRFYKAFGAVKKKAIYQKGLIKLMSSVRFLAEQMHCPPFRI